MMDFLIGMGWYVIPFLVVISILVFVHELGHFLAARYNGVGVTTFAIGFGPEVFGYTDTKGTRWSFRWMPMGGYVKMIGEDDLSEITGESKPEDVKANEELSEKSLHTKTVWQRMAVTVAGPAANFAFAIAIFAVMFSTMGQRYTAPVVEDVKAESAAAAAGIQKGDRFISIEGEKIVRFEDVQAKVHTQYDKPLAFVIERAGQQMPITITPRLGQVKDVFGNVNQVGLLGVGGAKSEYMVRPWYMAVPYAVNETASISWNTLKSLWEVVTGARSGEGLGGPLRIAQMSGDIAQSGMIALIWFMALLSVNLGLINLFPVPMLDGGHLIFYIFEAIRGKPIPPGVQGAAFRVGLILILSLMVWATWNDVGHFIKK